jgi:peptidylprolyl isomerase domain and WD repeat-containing protein 1
MAEDDSKTQSKKRSRSDDDGKPSSKLFKHSADVLTDSSSDDDMGPQLPSAEAPKKKRRKLPYEML